jgi:hypothetical protein
MRVTPAMVAVMSERFDEGAASFQLALDLAPKADPGVTYTATDVILRSLHGDPRWPPFLQRMGLA